MAESGRKMAATVKAFSDDLSGLGLGGDHVFVDFVAQNKIYGFEIAGELAREKLVGFELKKNVSIHYRDRGSARQDRGRGGPVEDLRPDQGRLRAQGHQLRPGQAHGRGRPDHQAEDGPLREAPGDQAPAPGAGLRRAACDPLPDPDVRLVHGPGVRAGEPRATTGRSSSLKQPARAGRSSSTVWTATASTP